MLNFEKIPDNRLLAYFLTVFSLVLPGLTLIILKDFDCFYDIDNMKLILLSIVISFPFYILNLVLTIFSTKKENLEKYSTYIIIAIKTKSIVYLLIAINLTLFNYFEWSFITSYIELIIWYIIILIFCFFVRKYFDKK